MDSKLAEKLAALRGGSVGKFNQELGDGPVKSASGQSGAAISNLVASSMENNTALEPVQTLPTLSTFLPENEQIETDFLSPQHFSTEEKNSFSCYGFVCQEYKMAYDEILKNAQITKESLDDLLGWAIEIEECYLNYRLLSASKEFNDAGWKMTQLLKDLQYVEFGTEEYDAVYHLLSEQSKLLLQCNAHRLEQAKNKQLFPNTPISKDLKGKPLSELLARVYKHSAGIVEIYEKELAEDNTLDLERLYSELCGTDPRPDLFLKID